jgi:hypothetical protein
MIRIPRHDPLPETALQRLVIARLNDIPGVRVWRFNVGAFKDPKSGKVYKFGVPGQADVGGILAPSGRRLEVELKSATGRQTEDQRAWQLEIETRGGLYVLARTLEQALVPVCHALGLQYAVEG